MDIPFERPQPSLSILGSNCLFIDRLDWQECWWRGQTRGDLFGDAASFYCHKISTTTTAAMTTVRCYYNRCEGSFLLLLFWFFITKGKVFWQSTPLSWGLGPGHFKKEVKNSFQGKNLLWPFKTTWKKCASILLGK